MHLLHLSQSLFWNTNWRRRRTRTVGEKSCSKSVIPIFSYQVKVLLLKRFDGIKCVNVWYIQNSANKLSCMHMNSQTLTCRHISHAHSRTIEKCNFRLAHCNEILSSQHFAFIHVFDKTHARTHTETPPRKLCLASFFRCSYTNKIAFREQNTQIFIAGRWQNPFFSVWLLAIDSENSHYVKQYENLDCMKYTRKKSSSTLANRTTTELKFSRVLHDHALFTPQIKFIWSSRKQPWSWKKRQLSNICW